MPDHKMEFTYAPDFVITRKRKRSAQQPVDPSLGYYVTPPPPPPQVEATVCHSSQHNAPSLKPQGALSSLDLGAVASSAQRKRGPSTTEHLEESTIKRRPPERKYPDAGQVIVEDFLHWSARSPKRPKTRRFVDLNTAVPAPQNSNDLDSCGTTRTNTKRPSKRNGDDEYQPGLSDSDDIEDDFSDTSEVPARVKPKAVQRKRKAETFSSRLLRAAVLSGVDVGETNDVVSTGGRRPLKFGTMLHLPPSSTSHMAKARKHRLINPGKTIMPSRSDFSAFKKPYPADPVAAGYKPISAWQPFPLSSASPKSAKSKLSQPTKVIPLRKCSIETTQVQPLQFGRSWKEYIAACGAIKSGKLHDRPKRDPNPGGLQFKSPVPVHKPIQKLEPSPFPLDVATFVSELPASSPVVDFSSSSACLPSTSPIRNSNIQPGGAMQTSIEPSSKNSCKSTSLDSRNNHPSHVQPQTAPLSAVSRELLSSVSTVCSPKVKAEPAKDLQTKKAGTSKPLRPLTSFFPEFIETARMVKRQEELQKSAKSRSHHSSTRRR